MCSYLHYKEAYVGHVLIDICVYHCVIRMLHFTGQAVFFFLEKNHDPSFKLDFSLHLPLFLLIFDIPIST